MTAHTSDQNSTESVQRSASAAEAAPSDEFSAAALPPVVFPKAPVRIADLRLIVRFLQRGLHCAVVAPSNYGKSALLVSLPQIAPLCRLTTLQVSASQPVSQPASQSTLQNDNGSNSPFVVFVDCLEAAHTEQAFYELLLRRILEEVDVHNGTDDSDASDEISEALQVLYREILMTESGVVLRASFAAAIRQLMQDGTRELVLVLDEFDDIFRALEPWPLRQLRALADANSPRLRIVTATSRRLADLRSDDETYEFRELFHLSIYLLPLLDRRDVETMVAWLDGRSGQPLPPDGHTAMHQLCGGHPGLLERLHAYLTRTLEKNESLPQLTGEKLIDKALADGAIRKECQRLWNELEEEEQRGLLLLAGAQSAANAVRPTELQEELLRAKGLVDASDTIFSPVFAAFVREMSGPVSPQIDAPNRQIKTEHSGLVCDLVTGQIWYDGEEITYRFGSENQRQLVLLLYSRSGLVCSYDDIAEHVWGVGEGVTPAAIRELANRVQRKLPEPHLIKNVPGKGYRLLL